MSPMRPLLDQLPLARGDQYVLGWRGNQLLLARSVTSCQGLQRSRRFVEPGESLEEGSGARGEGGGGDRDQGHKKVFREASPGLFFPILSHRLDLWRLTPAEKFRWTIRRIEDAGLVLGLKSYHAFREKSVYARKLIDGISLQNREVS